MQSKFPLFCQFFKSSHTVFIEHLTCAKSIIISYLNWNMLTINYMKQRYDFHSEMCAYILAVFKNTIKHKENCFLKPTPIIHFWIWKVNGKVSEYQASLCLKAILLKEFRGKSSGKSFHWNQFWAPINFDPYRDHLWLETAPKFILIPKEKKSW